MKKSGFLHSAVFFSDKEVAPYGVKISELSVKQR